MLKIPYGRSLFGKVDRVAGEGLIATECWHIAYAPVIPLRSWFVTEETETGWRGARIKLHGRSVLKAYLGGAWILFGIPGILTLVTAQNDPGAETFGGSMLGISAGLAVVAASSRLLWRKGKPRFRETTQAQARARMMPQPVGPITQRAVLPPVSAATTNRVSLAPQEHANASEATARAIEEPSTLRPAKSGAALCSSCGGRLATVESLRAGRCRNCRGLGVPPAAPPAPKCLECGGALLTPASQVEKRCRGCRDLEDWGQRRER